MSKMRNRAEQVLNTMNRRLWIGSAAGAAITGWGMIGKSALAHALEAKKATKEEENELEETREKLRKVGLTSISVVRAPHYQAIGDASERFIKVILSDSERLALDYLDHFRARGFEVTQPSRRLTVVVFQDDRSFGKFFRLPSILEAAERGQSQPVGIYVRTSNLLHIFDWRNVPIVARAGHHNMQTLSHEGTHQLTFNTGLLNRAGDIPLCIVEGFGTYGEPRKLNGRCDLGRISLRRLEDLAKIQRRRPWIPIRELFANDTILRGPDGDQVMLAYAESWVLVHFLMKGEGQLPGFKGYLKAIQNRTKPEHRLQDAETHLGNLETLDRTLRRYAIGLQMSL